MNYELTKKPNEPALITELFARRLAYPFARYAYKLGISANAVTIIAGLCWVLCAPLAVVAGWAYDWHGKGIGLTLWFLCGVLWNAGYILDLADGSLARMTGTSSRRGSYLDYVFHLLTKPAFLLSIGIGIFLANGGGLLWLLVAVLSIPANWSATACAVEHVLCEEFGRGKFDGGDRNTATFRQLWLGVTDINDAATDKAATPLDIAKALVKEIFSYYGQFTFFSITVGLDIIIAFFSDAVLPVTSFCFLFVSLVFIVRLPFKVYREYKRIALSD